MIKANLTPTQELELKRYRSTAQSENSERALMVLMSDEGYSPSSIAKVLKRHDHTVRDWLKRYIENGIDGLQRKYAPGKNPKLRESVSEEVETIIDKSPLDFGYKVSLWTTALIANYLKEEKGIKASQDTIERALTRSGYTYRRGARKPTLGKLNKQEKIEAIEALVENIRNGLNDSAEVLALDESHFSTEPYVVSGWQKKLWPSPGADSEKEGKVINVWRIKFGNSKILLEEHAIR